MPRGRRQFNAQTAWWLAYGVLCGLAAAGLIVLLVSPRRGQPIQLVAAPTAAATAAGDTAPRQATLTPLVAPKLPLDLNQATPAELEYLPGIGPSTALLIVSYREQHGPFASVEQLLEIPGIGPRTLEGLRPFAFVEANDD